MYHKTILLRSAILILAVLCVGSCSVSGTQDSGTAALQGLVRSQEEGAMEGVLVSAKRVGSTVTTTVVSDAQGRYSFPRNRLQPGPHMVRVRAVGYETENPGAIEVTAEKAAELDIELAKAQDLAPQLSNGEWLLSLPGTDEQKKEFLNCTTCHTLERVVRSRDDAAEFAKVIQRMSGYSQGSTPQRPQSRPGHGGGMGQALPLEGDARQAKAAQYAASINLSKVPRWQFPLKALPRPKGKATLVIITEYDLPRPEALPHDAAVDRDGMVWYADFGSQYLGKLDPTTAKIVEYPMPLTKPGAPTGSLDLNFDREGNIWLGMMYQGNLARFSPGTEKFQTWPAPRFMENDNSRMAMVTPNSSHVDGKVWVGADDEYQVDLKTGEWRAIDYSRRADPKASNSAGRLSSYGVAADSNNNFYGMNLNGKFIIKVDAKTMEVTPYPTPTPDSGPRRGHMDSQDRLWFAEFRGNKIGMFDTRSERFQEWAIATPWTNPYDAILDGSGFAWAGGMSNDHVARVNTKTGEMVEYLLPSNTNIRRVNVDNSTSPPTFWVGNNLGASIVKVEPLE